VRLFFLRNPQVSSDDPQVRRLREELARHLEAVAAETRSQFGDPWGLVAMDRVSDGRAHARVEITGPTLALRLERGVTEETEDVGRGFGRGAGGP